MSQKTRIGTAIGLGIVAVVVVLLLLAQLPYDDGGWLADGGSCNMQCLDEP